MHHYARCAQGLPPNPVDELVLGQKEHITHSVNEIQEFGAAELLSAFPEFRITFDREAMRFGLSFDGIYGAGTVWERAEWTGEFAESPSQLMDRAVRDLLFGSQYVAFRHQAQWWYARPKAETVEWEIVAKDVLDPKEWPGLLADFQLPGYVWPGGKP